MPRRPSLISRVVSPLTILLVCSVTVTGCAFWQRRAPTEPVPAKRLYALLINGGGSKAANYQSHLTHIRSVLAYLRAIGVGDDAIDLFNSDGQDPGADLAGREHDPVPNPERWRLRGTRLQDELVSPVRYSNTTIDGIVAQPATREAINQWFAERGTRLGAGDTLLLYVTDHGDLNQSDKSNNTIRLWGPNQQLAVRDLAGLLESLDSEVRVVTLMSQCFSGSFAGLTSAHARAGQPSGNVCGYFSSTADRPAYGCYPESRGVNDVGHSVRFLAALAQTGRFADAHRQTLVTDDTPDVPLRTSDVYLERLLQSAAEKQGRPFETFVNELLDTAWRNKSEWEQEIRLLDRIGKAFGSFSPRSPTELAGADNLLPDLATQMRNLSGAWGGALRDANHAELERFLRAEPAWAVKLDPKALKEQDDEQRQELIAPLLTAMAAAAESRPAQDHRLKTLAENADANAALSYRMSVRLGAVERMRFILLSIAGQIFLRTDGDEATRAAYKALRDCEDLRLPALANAPAAAAEPAPFPPLNEDISRSTASLPAWIGVRFGPLKDEQRQQLKLEKGAAAVLSVYPGSPAEKAGIQLADIFIGPPGHPFTEQGELRSWTLLSEIGKPKRLQILRDARVRTISLTPGVFPMKWPDLPGPPKVGASAPPVKVVSYRGKIPANGPRLLFFWATWCAPCKAALPDVLAFEKETNIPVIAITDEPAAQLDAFFAEPREFPRLVAIDEMRKTSLSFAVSGTPTFVLLDATGKVQAYSSGYAPSRGLGVPRP